PQESIIFVVGIMEIIKSNFYIYANEISNIDISNISISDSKNQALAKSAQSKLLFTHQNIKNIASGFNIKIHSDDLADKYQYEVLSDDLYSLKRKRNKGTDNNVKNLEEIRSFKQDNFTEDEKEELLLDDNKKKENLEVIKKVRNI
ncbi:7550_t:CDS:1, partial [Cetraspora pellucida]